MEPAIKPKICVLFCGGTIVMKKSATGALDITESALGDLLALEPRLKENFELSEVFINNIDSTNMTPSVWDDVAIAVKENYAKYDGFVVCHGTNTMGYTSAALSFALLGIGKPVVLTGAQIPLSEPESDARRNFVNAVKIAAMDLSGVFVVFGSKIIRGSRAKKVSEYEIDAFKTFSGEDVGEIGITIKLKGQFTRRHSNPFNVKTGFEANILVLTLEPGINAPFLEQLLELGAQGFVLRAYGAGDIPYTLDAFLEKAHEKQVPILVTTQCPQGATQLGINDVGLQAKKRGVIEVFDMSMEAMTTKLRWLLSRNTPYSELKEKIQTDLVGEVAPPLTYPLGAAKC